MRALARFFGAVILVAVPCNLLAQSIDTTVYSSLRWRNTGPLRGGRSVAAAGSQARPTEYWMGTTGGGVFKSSDQGETWTAVTDRYFGGTIGAIAVAESNPDIVYVGGGEFPIRGNVSHGDGVYKTTDAGRTWAYLGLVETRQIAKIRVHPRNPDLVYVAALGQVFGPTPDRGIYKSTDGGVTWRKVLFRNDSTGAIDLSMDANDPAILYAAFWQAGRTPWQLVSGGAGSGIFKSIDGGENWTEITRNPGLPKGLVGNIGISASPAQSGLVYALIESDSGGVFRSDNGGASWTRVNTERKLRQRAWYYSRIYADSRDPNTVWASNVSFQKSVDGGRTWSNVNAPHGDSHDFWIAPEDNRRMIEANDGGANVSRDGGRTWTDQDYLTAQFYHVATTNHFPYRICGAQQDNSTVCGSSRGGQDDGPVSGDANARWYDVGGCESGYIAARPDDPDVVYAGCYGGYLGRTDVRTGASRDISPWPMNPMGHSAGDLKYRPQWTYPIVISPHDPKTLYIGSNVLFRTTNDGDSFEAISPDLTRNDPRTLGASGGPITKDQTSVEYYGTVFTVSESPVEKGVIWAGSDDGLVHVSRDNGKSWTKVTPPDALEWTRMSIIEASPHQAGAAYLAGNRFQLNDYHPYLWKTTDYGQSWTRIVTGIRPSDFTRVIREDPEKRGLLYAGTERGVWVSFNDGAAWQSLQLNLPPVPIHDLVVKEGDIVVASHGRSFWILDDISVLRQLTPAELQKDFHLFAPRAAYRTPGLPGAQINYWLKTSGQKVTLEFLDARGQSIRSYTSDAPDSARTATSSSREAAQARTDSLRNLGVLPAAAAATPRAAAARSGEGGPPPTPRAPNAQGLNRFTWNLRYADASRFPGMIFWAAGTAGPVAPPGTYSVRLSVGDKSETVPVTLQKDPRSTATAADLEEQFALALQIRDKTTEANDAVRTIRNVKAQLALRQKEAGTRGTALDRLARPFVTELSAVEGEIYQVKNESSQDPLNYPIRLNNKIAALAGVVSGAEARPTRQTVEVFRILSDSLGIQTGRLRKVLDGSLPPINREIEKLGLKAIVPGTGEIK